MASTFEEERGGCPKNTRRRMARERRGAESSVVSVRHYITRQYIKDVV